MGEINSIKYYSWPELKRDIFQDIFNVDYFCPGKFLFRGQLDSEWPLKSSFDRWFERSGLTNSRGEVSENLLLDFSRELVNYRSEIPKSHSRPELIALGQHHGLPTRSLDWTESPYVAAFFAFFGDHSGKTSDSVAIWVLHIDAGVWEKELGVEICIVSAEGNARMKNQKGVFTICRTPHDSLEKYVLDTPNRDVCLTKISLPRSEKKNALRDLAAMGITPGSMFPGFEGAAKSAKQLVSAKYDID